MNKRFLTVVVVVAITTTLSVNAIASPTKSDLNNQKTKTEQQQKSTQGQLDTVKKQISSMESEIETYDSQITTLMVQINSTQKQIDSTQKDISQATADLNKAEEDIKNQQELFSKRMQAIYKSGSESYLSVVLDSKSLGDFISRVESLKKITQYDDKMIDDLKAKKEDINKKEQDLKSKQDKLVSLKNGQVASKNSLVQKQNDEKKLIAQYQTSQKSLESQLEVDKKTITNIQNQIHQLELEEEQAALNNKTGSTYSSGDYTSSDAVGPKLVAYAMTFLGIPYEWGGNGPATFDCSGFTRYVYAHYGIYLPRTSEEQALVGKRLTRSQLQVGDLCLFMNSAGDCHHVAIYVGGGMYIHAPHPGDHVKISPLDGTDFCWGVRVR